MVLEFGHGSCFLKHYPWSWLPRLFFFLAVLSTCWWLWAWGRQFLFLAKKRGNIDGSLMSCQPQTTQRDRYEKDSERVRDVTGAWIVKVENERQLERERHLEGQQEQRVQREEERESRARWSYVQSSEEGCGCFVSSYRLRVICLLQLCRPAVTRRYAPLCPGIRLPLPTIICLCVCSTFVSLYTCRLLACKWAGSGYLSSMNQYESLSMPFPPSSRELRITVASYEPTVFPCSSVF